MLDQSRLSAAVRAQDPHSLPLIHDKLQTADLDLRHIRVDMGDTIDFNDPFPLLHRPNLLGNGSYF